MVISAHFEDLPAGAGQPRGPRRKLLLEARGATAAGASAPVLVHDISASGLLLESDPPPAVGETIEIELPLAGPTRATAVWTSGRLAGCQFESPLGEAALSAAQLRSAPPAELPPEESFGARLQRLRKQRGLSLDELASALGVSKPAVWGWEQGRSRPVESRLDALVAALGVARAELEPDRGGPAALRELLAHSKEQIARAAGTTADRIRIMIEL